VRHLYDAFHLEVRYDLPSDSVILRVTIEAETAPALANAVNGVVKEQPAPETQKPGVGADQATTPGEVGWDVLSAPGRKRGASATIPDLQGRAVVEIDYRYVLSSK
jgi:hypothetical protein